MPKTDIQEVDFYFNSIFEYLRIDISQSSTVVIPEIGVIGISGGNASDTIFTDTANGGFAHITAWDNNVRGGTSETVGWTDWTE